MPKRNRRSKKSAMILPVLLIGSSVLVTCVGFALKARLKTVGGYERQLAVAVPFLMLYDDTDLHLPQSPSAPVSTEPSAPQTTPQETEPVTVPATQQPETTAPAKAASRLASVLLPFSSIGISPFICIILWNSLFPV